MPHVTAAADAAARATRSWVVGSAAVVLIAAAAFSLHPLRSPWWYGRDWESVYAATALSVVQEHQPAWYDHPGYPIQQALAATFVAHGAVTREPSRRAEALRWYRDMNAVRPYLRTWAAVFVLAAAFLVFVAVGRTFGHPAWGVLAAVMLATAPGLLNLAAVISPDWLLCALAVTSCALAAAGVRERRAELYVAAAAVAGFATTLKLTALALVVPLAAGLVLGRPDPSFFGRGARAVLAWVARHRRALIALALAWAAAVAALGPGSPRPLAGDARWAAFAFVTLAAVVAAPALLLRRTRFAPDGLAAAAVAAAAAVGAVVPNTLFPLALPTLFHRMWLTSTGRGALAIEPFSGALIPPRPWLPLLAVAAFGLVRALRAGERDALVWAGGAAGLGAIAAARSGLLHYWAPSIVVATPLVLRAVGPRGRRPRMLAVAAVIVLVAVPMARGVQQLLGRRDETAAVDAANRWVRAHLAADEVALTTQESEEVQYSVYVRRWGPEAPPRAGRIRLLALLDERALRHEELRVRYVLFPEDVAGLEARLRRRIVPVAGIEGVYEVRTRKT